MRSLEKNLNKLNQKAVQILKKTPTSLVELANGKSVKSLPNSTNSKQRARQDLKQNLGLLGLAQSASKTTQKAKATLLSQYVFNKFFICCKESRIESPNSFYGCFYIGPFDESLSQTLAHNIRRTLLSQLSGFAITAVEIDGVLHKFSNLPGIKETVLDIICNLQNLVFKEAIKPTFALALKPANSITLQQMEFTAYLRVRGPGIVTAADIILPSGLQCVNPNQYIATLAEDGSLNMKIYISSGQGQNYIKQKQKNMDLNDIKQNVLVEQAFNQVKSQKLNSTEFNTADTGTTNSVNQSGTDAQNYLLTNIKKNKIYLDSVFMPVTKVNTIVQANDKCTDDLLENNLEFKFIPNAKQDGLQNQTTDSQLLTSADFDHFFSTSNFNIGQQALNNDSITLLGLAQSAIGQSTRSPRTPKSASKSSQVKNHQNSLANKNFINSTFFTTNNPYTMQQVLLNAQHKPNELGVSELVNQSDLNTSLRQLDNTPAFNKVKNQQSNQVLSAENLKEQFVVLASQQPNTLGGSPISKKKQSHIVVEIWTNGSIHPREALKNSLQFLSNTFVTLENVKMLGSIFKSDITYAKLLKKNK
jgi:DNA-directed RNA polymerase alpha subunit